MDFILICRMIVRTKEAQRQQNQHFTQHPERIIKAINRSKTQTQILIHWLAVN